MEVNYIGEHAWAGMLGHSFVLLSMVAAALATFSFFKREHSGEAEWAKLGRLAFRIHSFALVAAIAVLFVMLYNAWYEYDYVWKHRNNAMPIRYILSCFWEGHEGSFMLWSFWHMILGNFLLRARSEWQAPVMAFVSVAQVFLGSMLLGIYIGEVHIGNSPFLLLRQLPENIGLPWTSYPDYLSKFPQFMDGRGLNPLLQNYWMTIHPPTVFFGFASTIVPAAFAVAGLWKGKYHEWIKPALPWTFLGIMILGVGILMGGAWAYEALSFGGFWAWDPVENSSLVPWIVLLAAGHVMLINRNKARSTYSALLLAIASFVFVIYSNFLTNSGVLGDTSVHAFTDNGLSGQLSLYMAFFIAFPLGMLMVEKSFRRAYWVATAVTLGIALFSGQRMIGLHIWLLATFIMSIYSYKKFYPKEKDEENLWSREFWMFIASLVLVMSALQISVMTSRPVINILASPFRGILSSIAESFDLEGLRTLASGQMTDKTQPEIIAMYNKWQTPFALVITLIMAFTQFLRWKDTPVKPWLKQLGLSFGLALVLTFFTSYYFKLGLEGKNVSIILLFFGCWWAITANLDYLIRIAKGNVKISGSSIAHIGFGMVLLGAAVSTSQSQKISQNSSMTDITKLNQDFSNKQDILLFKKDTLIMGNQFISFQEKRKDDINIYFRMDYFGLEPRTYHVGEFIYSLGGIYRCKEEHAAGKNMIEDMDRFWEEVKSPSQAVVSKADLWNPYSPGEKLFSLEPRIQLNPKFGNVPEPDTKHYWNKDIYTHVRYGQLEDGTQEVDAEGYLPFKDHSMSIGDTLRSGARIAILDSLTSVKDRAANELADDDLAVRAWLRVISPSDSVRTALPLFILRESSYIASRPDEIATQGVKFDFTEIIPEEGKVTIRVAEKEENIRDFIVMQAIIFPWINILWAGIIIMALGTLLAVVQRFRRESV